MCLYNYSTTKADHKKGIDRTPNENPMLIDGNTYKQMMEGYSVEQEDLRSKRTTIYT